MENNWKLVKTYPKNSLGLSRDQIVFKELKKWKLMKKLSFEAIITDKGILDEVGIDHTSSPKFILLNLTSNEQMCIKDMIEGQDYTEDKVNRVKQISPSKKKYEVCDEKEEDSTQNTDIEANSPPTDMDEIDTIVCIQQKCKYWNNDL